MQWVVQISFFSEMLKIAIYSGGCRNATKATCMHDYEVEMESDVERRRSTRVRVQRQCRAEDDSHRQQ